MKFSEKIVRLRKIKGITQDELAGAVGVSRQAVYKWECGQSYPEVAKLIELKALFGISIDDLLDESFEVALPEKKRRKRAPRAKVERPAEAEPIAVIEEEETVHEDAVVVEVETTAEPTIEIISDEVVAAEPAMEAPVAEVPVEEPVAEEPVAEAPAEEPVAEEIAEEAPAEEEPEQKKRGFFSRLFGRK